MKLGEIKLVLAWTRDTWLGAVSYSQVLCVNSARALVHVPKGAQTAWLVAHDKPRKDRVKVELRRNSLVDCLRDWPYRIVVEGRDTASYFLLRSWLYGIWPEERATDTLTFYLELWYEEHGSHA